MYDICTRGRSLIRQTDLGFIISDFKLVDNHDHIVKKRQINKIPKNLITRMRITSSVGDARSFISQGHS